MDKRTKKNQVGYFKEGDVLVCKQSMMAHWGSILTVGNKYTIRSCEEYEQTWEDRDEYDLHRKNWPIPRPGKAENEDDFLKSERLKAFNQAAKERRKNKNSFKEQVVTVDTDDNSAQTFVLKTEEEISKEFNDGEPVCIFVTRNPVNEFFDTKQIIRERTLNKILR